MVDLRRKPMTASKTLADWIKANGSAGSDDHDSDGAGAGNDHDDRAADGGETEIRGRREISDGDLVRDVHNPDGRLYAYREDDEHVVVSRGNEPATRWTRRVRAERTAVAPGIQLWTIPDNWERRLRIDGAGNRRYAVYRIPEEHVDVLVTVPHKCHLVDKWYGVTRVGKLTVEYDDDSNDLAWDALAEAIERGRDVDAVSEADIAALEAVHNRRHVFERRFRESVNGWAEDALFETYGGEGHASLEDWTVDPWGQHPFEWEDLLWDVVDVDDRDVREAVEHTLRAESVVPNYPAVRVDVEADAGLPPEYYLRGLIQAGCSSTEAVDYLMVEIRGRSQAEWANERGVQRQSVNPSVASARQTIQA
jgi:hypothetical protein